MGYRLGWTETIGDMLAFGPNLQLKARCGHCGTWPAVDLTEWAQAYGADFTFWDWIEPCDRCGCALTFLCSPGPTTPMLPMWTEAGARRAIQHDDRIWRREMALRKVGGTPKKSGE